MTLTQNSIPKFFDVHFATNDLAAAFRRLSTVNTCFREVSRWRAAV
jgi:hypothetical protein